jgi:hypothetical protein
VSNTFSLSFHLFIFLKGRAKNAKNARKEMWIRVEKSFSGVSNTFSWSFHILYYFVFYLPDGTPIRQMDEMAHFM